MVGQREAKGRGRAGGREKGGAWASMGRPADKPDRPVARLTRPAGERDEAQQRCSQ